MSRGKIDPRKTFIHKFNHLPENRCYQQSYHYQTHPQPIRQHTSDWTTIRLINYQQMLIIPLPLQASQSPTQLISTPRENRGRQKARSQSEKEIVVDHFHHVCTRLVRKRRGREKHFFYRNGCQDNTWGLRRIFSILAAG